MGGLQLGILIGFTILIFVCFSVVPFFLLKKNYRKVKLLNKDDNGYILQTLAVVALMIFCCYKLISEEEFEILSLYRWFNKIIGESCE